MKPKPLVPRQRANRDVEAAVAWYLREGGPRAALGFIASLEVTYRRISRFPAAGSARYANELQVPGLRFCPLAKYPWLVFYMEREEHVDVWRVLASHRDFLTHWGA